MKLIKLIIHLSSQSSSINQLAWLIIRSQSSSINQLAGLIIRVIDYSAMIRQWLFEQPARVIDYSTMIESHWLFIRVVNRVQSTNSHEWLFDNDYSTELNQPARVIHTGQWLSHIDYSPARVIDYSTMIEPHWLLVINQPTHQIDYSFEWSSEFNQPTRMIDYSGDRLFNNDSTMIV